MPIGIAAPSISDVSSESDSEGSVHPHRAETDIAQHPAQRPTVLPDIDLRGLMCRETDRDVYDAAWSALHQRFAGGIYVFIQERVRDTALAEIVCADVWCAASEELTAATDVRSVASWIYRRAGWCIHNVWAQASRDARLFVQPLPECVPDHLDVHDALQADLPMDFSFGRHIAIQRTGLPSHGRQSSPGSASTRKPLRLNHVMADRIWRHVRGIVGSEPSN
jgi:hypothetical protein